MKKRRKKKHKELRVILLRLALAGAAHNRLNSRLYLQDIKWLCDIVVRSIFQSQYLIHIIALGSQHNNRHIGKIPDMLAYFKTIHLRKHDIQQNHVKFILGRKL